eukprot:4337264-Ditylum_brightwellii.AAC.1
MKSCKSFPPLCRQILDLLDGNRRCVDCGGWEGGGGSKDGAKKKGEQQRHERLKWASVTYGTVLCGKCAFLHIDKAEH